MTTHLESQSGETQSGGGMVDAGNNYADIEFGWNTGSNPVLTTNFNRSTCSRDVAIPLLIKNHCCKLRWNGRTGGWLAKAFGVRIPPVVKCVVSLRKEY